MYLPHLLICSSISVVWGSSCVDSVQSWNQIISPRSSGSFYLEHGIWKVLGAKCTHYSWWVSRPSLYRTGKHMFINTCRYAHLYIFLYLAICISIKILEVIRISLIAVHTFRPNSSFPSPYLWLLSLRVRNRAVIIYNIYLFAQAYIQYSYRFANPYPYKKDIYWLEYRICIMKYSFQE